MIALVKVGARSWSIADIDDDAVDLMWWCGDQDRWTSPNSSYWALMPGCSNVCFPTEAAASRFAKSRGWI